MKNGVCAKFYIENVVGVLQEFGGKCDEERNNTKR